MSAFPVALSTALRRCCQRAKLYLIKFIFSDFVPFFWLISKHYEFKLRLSNLKLGGVTPTFKPEYNIVNHFSHYCSTCFFGYGWCRWQQTTWVDSLIVLVRDPDEDYDLEKPILDDFIGIGGGRIEYPVGSRIAGHFGNGANNAQSASVKFGQIHSMNANGKVNVLFDGGIKQTIPADWIVSDEASYKKSLKIGAETNPTVPLSRTQSHARALCPSLPPCQTYYFSPLSLTTSPPLPPFPPLPFPPSLAARVRPRPRDAHPQRGRRHWRWTHRISGWKSNCRPLQHRGQQHSIRVS